MPSNKEEVIREVISLRKEAVAFFSNDSKKEREKWCVGTFLKNLHILFDENELLSVRDEPPDVAFRDASFEVKEIDEEGRKRHSEKKEKLKKAKSALSLRDLMEPYRFKEISLSNAICRMEGVLAESVYDPGLCRRTDALFYLNFDLIDEHAGPTPDQDLWRKWRSVSIVTNNNISRVLWATDTAPQFIRRSFV